VVLDGGGCWGDTALYFADAVGAEGKVYCFEFEEANLRRLEANLARNPELACRVQVVRRPMWSTPGQELRYDPMGPGTTVKPEGSPTARSVLTQSIDGLVREEGLAAVDFIKMDIEGAEMEALRGAEQTLRTFKPDLALSIYHSLEDYHRLAYFLEGLGLGYRFYLRHLTVHLEETVLFASARAHPSSHAHA
jgi:FkbM family methyltransferase